MLRDTLTRVPVGIILQSLDRSDSTAAVVLTASALDSGRMYRVSVANVHDRAGNSIDPAAAQFDFRATGGVDTLKPSLTFVGLRDSIREIPLATVFDLHFSEPVDTLAIVGGLHLLDSLKNAVPVTFRWSTAVDVWVAPQRSLHSNAWYTFRVQMDSLRDYWGNGYRDSVFVLRFQSLDLRTTGTIEGTVMDEQRGEHLGDIVLTALRVQTQSSSTASLRLKQPGAFKLEQLPEGYYTLRAYRDRDASGGYSFGRAFPFQPAERFAVYRDTVKVRARWAVEGVVIRFPATVENNGARP
jgi:hypothetical protein